MMNCENTLEQFRQKTSEMVSEIERRQTLLKEKLSQRSATTPQPGDIFVFKHPDTLGIQWVVLHFDEQNPQRLLAVPADDTPMVGSTDVQLPKSALCSPLTLRCEYGLWIHKTKFEMNLRVGVLEERHQQRVLDKMTQISEKNVRSTILQQETDDDLDYEQWMEQVYRAQEMLITQSPEPVPSGRMVIWINRIYQQLKNIVTNVATFPQGWGKLILASSVVTVFMLLFIIWLAFPPSLEQQINHIYQTSSVQAQNSQEVQQILLQTHISYSRGFSPSSQQTQTSARQAFDAGFQAGKHALSSSSTFTTDWQQSEWAYFFELGRSTLLLETVSIAVYEFQYEVPNTFWEEQKQIFATLQAKFNGFKAQPDTLEATKWVRGSFKTINSSLNRLPNENKLALYAELINVLRDMRENLP